MIGTTFKHGNNEYIIDSVDVLGSDMEATKNALVDTGKDAAFYYASKVLKSGKPSKQGGMFYRFTQTNNFIKVL